MPSVAERYRGCTKALYETDYSAFQFIVAASCPEWLIILANESDVFSQNGLGAAALDGEAPQFQNLARIGLHVDEHAKERRHHLLPGHSAQIHRAVRVRVELVRRRVVVVRVDVHLRALRNQDGLQRLE